MSAASRHSRTASKRCVRSSLASPGVRRGRLRPAGERSVHRQEYAATPRAALYGRIGTCGLRHARRLSSSTSPRFSPRHFDEPGCMMFPRPATGDTEPGRPWPSSRSASTRPRRGHSLSSTAGCRRRRWPRRSRRPTAGGADAGAGHGRGEPRALRAQRRPAGGGDGRARLHARRRHLPQRDDEPRGPDPADPRPRRASQLRPRLRARLRATMRAIRRASSIRTPICSITGRSCSNSRRASRGKRPRRSTTRTSRS